MWWWNYNVEKNTTLRKKRWCFTSVFTVTAISIPFFNNSDSVQLLRAIQITLKWSHSCHQLKGLKNVYVLWLSETEQNLWVLFVSGLYLSLCYVGADLTLVSDNAEIFKSKLATILSEKYCAWLEDVFHIKRGCSKRKETMQVLIQRALCDLARLVRKKKCFDGTERPDPRSMS